MIFISNSDLKFLISNIEKHVNFMGYKNKH
jgi:hypothetical protein